VANVGAHVEELMLGERREQRRRESTTKNRTKLPLRERNQADVRTSFEEIQFERNMPLKMIGRHLEMYEKHLAPVRKKQRPSENRRHSDIHTNRRSHVESFLSELTQL
jgi:hypothetical protein